MVAEASFRKVMLSICDGSRLSKAVLPLGSTELPEPMIGASPSIIYNGLVVPVLFRVVALRMVMVVVLPGLPEDWVTPTPGAWFTSAVERLAVGRSCTSLGFMVDTEPRIFDRLCVP